MLIMYLRANAETCMCLHAESHVTCTSTSIFPNSIYIFLVFFHSGMWSWNLVLVPRYGLFTVMKIKECTRTSTISQLQWRREILVIMKLIMTRFILCDKIWYCCYHCCCQYDYCYYHYHYYCHDHRHHHYRHYCNYYYDYFYPYLKISAKILLR